MEISNIIFSKEDNERVCNICQWEWISMDSGSGVCTLCAENRFNDKIWTKKEYELWQVDKLITCANGYVYNKNKNN